MKNEAASALLAALVLSASSSQAAPDDLTPYPTLGRAFIIKYAHLFRGL